MSSPVEAGGAAVYQAALDALAAVLAQEAVGGRFAPVSVTIDYSASSFETGGYVGEARITRRTRTIVFLDADIWRSDTRAHAAAVTAVYRVLA
jgi:acyl-coenzyme A thioesterase PaaI-like protein